MEYYLKRIRYKKMWKKRLRIYLTYWSIIFVWYVSKTNSYLFHFLAYERKWMKCCHSTGVWAPNSSFIIRYIWTIIRTIFIIFSLIIRCWMYLNSLLLTYPNSLLWITTIKRKLKNTLMTSYKENRIVASLS